MKGWLVRVLAWVVVGGVGVVMSIIALGHPGPADLPFKYAPYPFETFAWMVPCALDPGCRGTWLLRAFALNGIGNVAIFVPLGMSLYLALLVTHPDQGDGQRLALTSMVGMLVSISYEVIQIGIIGRVVATDDVLTNTLGTMLGAGAAWMGVAGWRRLRRSEL